MGLSRDGGTEFLDTWESWCEDAERQWWVLAVNCVGVSVLNLVAGPGLMALHL